MAYEVTNNEYLISTDASRLNVPFIHSFLSVESYWAKNIPFHIVEKSIANSLCFGIYNGNEQIGFARLVTDKATFAYLADVFIISDHRGKGLSKWLLKVIHAHAELQTLRRWMLGTRDAHELYKQFGWTPLEEPLRFMQRHNPHVYNSANC